MPLTPVQKLEQAKKVLAYMKFTRLENTRAWLHDERADTCEIWAISHALLVKGCDDPKIRATIDIPGLKGKEIVAILNVRGRSTGNWALFYTSYPQELKKYIYEKARTIEEEGKV